ncbi:cell surface protein [Alistipes finegoldii]|jgi:outer membrane protein assembly factor BamB|uniref:Cell surface protein n=1 Tax=Alistipes finegoldii TaxID=214856 RepID=A0AA37KT94_9BACT|nr:PQQ-binding-like beta-propeller repeat protein [Alistipes finegoldii]BDF64094.1 cell surface protein [Alistipes finegoldii]GKI20443.1 cell surface protein [Alistipes finegoldii]
MKKLIHICILSGLAALAASCWTEDIPEAGAARHQVEALTATPGDEEVTLAWEIPDGWNPTDYIVFYTDEESQTVTLRTGGASRYVVDKLTNGISYNFNVQAVYGKLISNAVTVAGRPSTSRLPVTDLTVTDTGDGYVALAWSAPSTLVEKYTLSYYIEDMPGDIRTQEIGKEQTAYRCEGLTNDKTWFFLLAAEYAKGPAEADVVRAMPTKAIPYFISSETAAVDQPVTFEFNRTAYADASDVTWTFPDGAVLTGDKVLSGFKTTGNQTVMLSAKIDGSSREWKITVEIRPYVVNFMDWEQADGAKYESPTYTCPVLSPDAGTVYVNTGNKVSNLYAFDVRTGKNKWTFRPTDNGDMQAESKSMVAVNPVSGDIYYGTSAGGQFYAVKPDGTLHWKFSKCGSMNSAPPAVSADGTVVYIADAKGALYALDAETGTERWSAPYAAGSCGYGLLVNGGEVVLAAKTAIHFVNAADGTKIEAVSVSIVNSIGFAVSPDRKKAYFAYATTLAAVDLDSHTLYARSAAGGDNYYQPIVAGDGTVFAGTKDGYVRFFSPDLQTMIHEEQPSSVKKNTFNFTRPLVDANNRFYIMASGNSTEDSLVLEYDTSGNKISDWSYTQNNCQNGCNLADGVLYTVNQGSGDGGNGLFIGKYIGAARGRGWSSHGGDHCGSGCIQSPLIEW